MPCVIYMRDMLEPVKVDESFLGLVTALQTSSTQGLAFIVMDDMIGGHVGIKIANINIFEEAED